MDTETLCVVRERLPEPVSKPEGAPSSAWAFCQGGRHSASLPGSPGTEEGLPSGCQFLQWALSSEYFQHLTRSEFWPSEETAANSACSERQQHPSFAVTSAQERARCCHHNPRLKVNRKASRRGTSSVPLPYLRAFLLPVRNTHRHSGEMMSALNCFPWKDYEVDLHNLLFMLCSYS